MRKLFTKIAATLMRVRQSAEQLTSIAKWYQILSEALIRYLKGRRLLPPPWLTMQKAATAG